jgi:subtilisin-like proprotein convertase family protein
VRHLRQLSALFVALSVLSFMGCDEGSEPNQQPVADPYMSEAPLSELDPLFEGAPSNAQLPEDGKADAIYPAQFDLHATQSPVKSQGSRGVCSIFATVALMEHLYIKEGTIKNPDFSEQFLQWSVKTEVGAFRNTAGSSARDNLAAISRYGIVDEPTWPYESSQWNERKDPRCTKGEDLPTVCYTNGDPSETVLAGTRWKLPSGRYVNSSPRSIKAFLTENKAGVVAGMTFFYQSWNHGASSLPVNSSYWSEGYVLYPNAKDQELSLEKRAGHAIMILGWDDELEVPILDENGRQVLDENGNPKTEKGFFLFKNSWGTSGFGIRNKFGAGYGWLSMKYVQEYATVYGSGVPKLSLKETCDDGIDNDFNGATDCDDAACESSSACKPSGLKFASTGASVDVPDNAPEGLLSVIQIDQPGVVGSVDVTVDITHPYRGDLQVSLIAPDGSTAILHDRSGGSTDDLRQTFTPDAFNGSSLSGAWTLKVVDTAKGDAGKLNAWSVEFRLTGELPAENCEDGIDNDANGFIDCADQACIAEPACAQAQTITVSNDELAEIPDNDSAGLVSTLNVELAGNLSALELSVDITHTFRPDLIVKLVHPSNAEIVIFNQEEADDDLQNLKRSFTVPDFIGLEAQGQWKLVVIDSARSDEGTLNGWSLTLTAK